MRLARFAASLATALFALAAPALGADKARASYSPYAGRSYAENVYFGDTHLHTSWSPDAGGAGNTRIDPDDAYRFARGEVVTGHNGEPVRLRRPLDFLVVSDHSEYMGLYPMLEEGLPELLATDTGKRWREWMREGKRGAIGAEFAAGLPSGQDLIASPAFGRTVWSRVVANAERHNQPGIFTTFAGYEWSSMPAGANLHRIVIFADGPERTGMVVPFRSIDSADPEALWAYLAEYEKQTGGRALAIPHNSNLSAGRMFERVDFKGKPFTERYAVERMRWEPLVEATQIKGDSETAPYLSPEDEFGNYGVWDSRAGMGAGPHADWMYEFEYVRPALGAGLALGAALGVNPFAFGLIGSTDSHTGLATADDADFWGKFSSNEPHAGRVGEYWSRMLMPDPNTPAGKALAERGMGEDSVTGSLVASGYAAVWARANTRDALFDAMRKKETYATTGPRMVLRFFGGFAFAAADASAPELAETGYEKGVPMGGTLTRAKKGQVPSFLVSALRDPDGANLDRIQIVKQWIDADGKRVERIYDIAVSGGRAIGADGRCRTPVGNTVDLARASYSNTIGAGELGAVWRDPDFDPKRAAVYYLRVLEIPTPRWTAYDAARYGTPPEKGVEHTTQERAYTSPIWYEPG